MCHTGKASQKTQNMENIACFCCLPDGGGYGTS